MAERPAAIVTGGRQGIGRGTALALAASGFNLIIVDRVEDERTEATLSDLGKLGAKARFFKADIADVSGLPELAEKCWSAFGSVESLVNNAGVAVRPLTDVMDVDLELFDRLMNVNMRGTFFFTQAVAKRMLSVSPPAVHRSIITVTSIAAGMTSIDRSPYNFSKAALSSMVNTFAIRLGPAGISCYEIRPGFITTDMTASGNTKKTDERIAAGLVPIARWGTVEDVGQTIATLAAGNLPYATGQVFYVDGGVHVQRP
jgi:3-oxoacyl-[acyl-carrier protein] reductase